MVKWRVWNLVEAELDHIKKVLIRLLEKEVSTLKEIIDFISEAESILAEYLFIKDLVNYSVSVPEELEEKVNSLNQGIQQLISKIRKIKSL